MAAILAQAVLWYVYRKDQAIWLNVPPAPDIASVTRSFLSDDQFAYRSYALRLQNLGDLGGQATPLRFYDYGRLEEWLFLMNRLDSRSRHIPYLAAYYFGSVQDNPDKKVQLRSIVKYLRHAGAKEGARDWFWMAQAALLARYGMKDYDLALEIANELKALEVDNMPLWAREMPVFIQSSRGETQAAHDLIINILKNEADNMHPAEIFVLTEHLCTKVLDAEHVKQHPVCQEFLK